MYDYNCQGHIATVKDVLQPPKKYDRCQRHAHVPEKADLHDIIVQTTNQTATHVQSPTTITKYQVVAL